jgi:phage tail sheath protein FI
MATRTIASPGDQITEVDLSLIARPISDTSIFMAGFSPQGPTDELINVGSVSEFESIFGQPENSAERYFYHSAKQVLNGSGNLWVTRMPYGSATGAGFANTYSALVYPLSSNGLTYATSTAFLVLEPSSILISDAEYEDLVQGNVSWGAGYTTGAITKFDDISKGGLVVVNNSKTTVNNLFEGYYVGLADNSNNNPATDFDALSGMKSANAITNNQYQSFTRVPESRLSFTLTATYSAYGTGSISEVIEGVPTNFDFGTSYYNDSLTLALFKIRSSIYAQDTVTLDYLVSEGYVGSLYANRTQNDVNGGAPKPFFLDSVANVASPNLKVITNPYISNTGVWLDSDGLPQKTVRVANAAKNLYSAGVYVSDTNTSAKDVGNVPLKVQRALRLVETADDVRIDVTAEAGLGTVWTGAKARAADVRYSGQPQIFDENYKVDISALKATDNSIVAGVRDDYLSIANQFVSLAQNVRKDHIFVADGLRYIYVNGESLKTAKTSNYVFSTDIYWPLKNLYAGVESSYVTTFGNWVKVADAVSSKQVWIPVSGFIGAKCAEVDRNAYPWVAIGGFNRGTLVGVTDIGVVTTQKQRDLLYKININPIAYFPNDGFVIYGQKTMYKKPSAFDRINVRRLFLHLEKATQDVLKYFLFENNTFATRTRVVGALEPIFEQARINDGVYAYNLICDSRNNDSATIDANEMRVSIYLQPVRTAEFILADFIATRTGVNFNELIG